MKQKMMGVAVASAAPYTNHLDLTHNHASTSSLNFYRSDALLDAKPTVKALPAKNGIQNAQQTIIPSSRLSIP